MKVEDKSADFERLKERGQKIAWTIDKLINPGMADASDAAHRSMGFGLLIFPFGDSGDATWISNANRDDVICAVEEWLRDIKQRRHRT